MKFDPRDPFPLLSASAINYESEKAHAREVDAWLGLRIAETETRVARASEGQENWKEKGPDVFLTPYTELRTILAELNPGAGQMVVDLGAGYGRMGFVMHVHHPAAEFLGFELVPERVAEGERVLRAKGCAGARLECCDLSLFTPPPADFYFLYDYGSRSAIAKTLADLRGIAAKRVIRLVGRGRAIRDAVERGEPWLADVVSPLHRPNYSIYSSG